MKIRRHSSRLFSRQLGFVESVAQAKQSIEVSEECLRMVTWAYVQFVVVVILEYYRLYATAPMLH